MCPSIDDRHWRIFFSPVSSKQLYLRSKKTYSAFALVRHCLPNSKSGVINNVLAKVFTIVGIRIYYYCKAVCISGSGESETHFF